MDLRATRGLRRLPGDTSGRASSTAATRRANATLDARARAWWLHGCSICAGTQMAGGDGPCRCRAPTRTRPTPTRKALPAARGVRLGCAWAYSAATVTRHGSRAAILISGGSIWGRPFLGIEFLKPPKFDVYTIVKHELTELEAPRSQRPQCNEQNRRRSRGARPPYSCFIPTQAEHVLILSEQLLAL